MGNLLPGHLLPKHFARLTVQTHNGELIDFRRFGAAAETVPAFASTRSLAGRRAVSLGPGRWWLLVSLGGLCLDLLASSDRGLEEDPVVPDDGSGLAAAGDLHLPLDVVRLAPGGGRIGRWRHAVLERPAPLRPVVVWNCGRLGCCGKSEGAGQAKEGWPVLSCNPWFHISSKDNYTQGQKSHRAPSHASGITV